VSNVKYKITSYILEDDIIQYTHLATWALSVASVVPAYVHRRVLERA
jgi:hypothetical protein